MRARDQTKCLTSETSLKRGQDARKHWQLQSPQCSINSLPWMYCLNWISQQNIIQEQVNVVQIFAIFSENTQHFWFKMLWKATIVKCTKRFVEWLSCQHIWTKVRTVIFSLYLQCLRSQSQCLRPTVLHKQSTLKLSRNLGNCNFGNLMAVIWLDVNMKVYFKMSSDEI